MHSEVLDEETALRHTAGMIADGLPYREIHSYLQSKGVNHALIEKMIDQITQDRLRTDLKKRTLIASAGLVAAAALYLLYLYQQRQQDMRIQQLVDQGKSVSIGDLGEVVILPGADSHIFLGKLAAFSAIFGLAFAFGAFRTWRSLKNLTVNH